jgi:hypothetical protein
MYPAIPLEMSNSIMEFLFYFAAAIGTLISFLCTLRA